MQNQIDITQLALNDLKALVYDNLAMLEQSQNNINALNAEIRKRTQAETAEINETEHDAEVLKRLQEVAAPKAE